MQETVSNPSQREDLSQGMAKSRSTRPSIQDQYGRTTEYHLYIFNISDYPQTIEKPWIKGPKVLSGKKANEEYTCVLSIPHPMMLPKENFDSNEVEFIPTSGRQIVDDLLNPTNDVGGTNNLAKRGCFVSMTPIPKPEEIQTAVVKMEVHFRDLLEKARVLEMSDPKSLQELVNAEYHHAAEYFGETDLSWHKKQTRPVSCPTCGENIKPGLAFHRDSANDLCVIDWQRTVGAGKKTFEDAENAGQDTSTWKLKRPIPKVVTKAEVTVNK